MNKNHILVVSNKVIAEFVKKYPIGKFKPFARYVESLCMIEILTKDCSICEKQINPVVFALIDNETGNYVGVIFRGVARNMASMYLTGGKRDFENLINAVLRSVVRSDKEFAKFIVELKNIEIEKVEPVEYDGKELSKSDFVRN